MKKFFIIILFLNFILLHSINVEYLNSAEKETMNPIILNGLNYYNLKDVCKIFKTNQYIIDYEFNKINLYIFNETIVFYIDTIYYSFQDKLHNQSYKIIQNGNDFLLAEPFLTNKLVSLFPSKVIYNIDKKILKIEKPVDNRIKTIVLDPGHGGRDPGAVGKKYKEKDIVLDVSKRLKEQLEKELGVKVLLTRSKDEYVALQERTKFANNNKGDLFISLHCNASRAAAAKGIEVYFMSTARTDEERAIEAFENSVVNEFEGIDAARIYDDLAFILFDLTQSENIEESRDLAVRLQNELIAKSKAIDRGVQQANFYVLRGAFMPAVLIELGFLTNTVEENNLVQKSYQDMLISAIINGIKSFKIKYDFIW